jgi:hypothetical protein
MSFASARLLFAVAATLGGCQRHLDLSLALASDSCTVTVPAGGSLDYQIDVGGADGGARIFCGGCLAVPNALAPDAIVPFLRAQAPACSSVPPGATLTVKLTASSLPGCPEDPGARLFCSSSQPLTLPDGHGDAVAVAVLTCDLMCSGGCRPSTCPALGKDCGMLSDGCNGTLSCGDCTRPLRCGGGGVPNVCGK